MFRQLHQRWQWYQLGPGNRNLGECCGAGKHSDVVGQQVDQSFTDHALPSTARSREEFYFTRGYIVQTFHNYFSEWVKLSATHRFVFKSWLKRARTDDMCRYFYAYVIMRWSLTGWTGSTRTRSSTSEQNTELHIIRKLRAMKLRLLNAYLIVGHSKSWPRVLNRMAPCGLGFTVHNGGNCGEKDDN